MKKFKIVLSIIFLIILSGCSSTSNYRGTQPNFSERAGQESYSYTVGNCIAEEGLSDYFDKVVNDFPSIKYFRLLYDVSKRSNLVYFFTLESLELAGKFAFQAKKYLNNKQKRTTNNVLKEVCEDINGKWEAVLNE